MAVGVTYDAGLLIGIDRNAPRATNLHRRFVERGTVPVVPAGVLAQVMRDPARQARLGAALRQCRIESLDEFQARRVGLLARRTGATDVVDLCVAEGALRRGDLVVSSDPGDLEACGVPTQAVLRV